MMDQAVLKELVRLSLLQQIWDKTSMLVDASGFTSKEFGENLTGHHSWYSDAVNNNEDVRISSFFRILGFLYQEGQDVNGKGATTNLLSEEVLKRAEMFAYLSSTKEQQEFLREIIEDNFEQFLEIRRSLEFLYRSEKLGSAGLVKGYEQLKNTLNELERESNG